MEGMTGSGSRGSDRKHGIRDRNLPARPRAALEGVLGLLATELERLIRTSLNDLEQALFKLAEQSRSNQEQQRCFEALREVRRGRADVGPRFFLHLETALASVGEDRRAPAFSKSKGGQRELSLVAAEDLDVSLALMEAASKAEIRNSQALFALGQRFGVLAEGPAFEADELPVGPHQLCECIRLAADALEVAPEFRVMFFRHFDRCVFGEYAQLLEQINRSLIEARILPNLILSLPRHRRAESDGANGSAGHGVGSGAGHTPSSGRAPERAVPVDSRSSAPAPEPLHSGAPMPSGAPPKTPPNPNAAALAPEAPAISDSQASAPMQPVAAQSAVSGGGGARSNLAELMQSLARSRAAAAGAGGNPAEHPAPAPTGHSSIPNPSAPNPLSNLAPPPSAAIPPMPKPLPSGPASIAPTSAANEPARRPGTPGHLGKEVLDDLHLPGFSRPMTGWPGVAQKVPTDAANDAFGQMVFDDMRELLAGRRQALGLSPTLAPDSIYPIRHDDIESVLAGLQSRPVTPMFTGGKVTPRTVSHIKQDMLNQLRQLAPSGKAPSLQSEDADTFDLVGLLFDSLLKEGTTTTPMSNMMSRLQVPLLRVALRDKSFFTKRTHPARQFLNAVAETGMYWLDGSDEDRSLLDKMQVVIDRVVHEFQDNVDVFDDLLGDLARHMQTVVRKSDVAERRQVDALKGREKLDHARVVAQKAIADRLAGRKLKTLIKTLLEQAWTDVLALTVLRHGEDSDAFRRRMELVDRLIAAGTPGQDNELQDASTRVELRQEVETGLAQVGVHHEDVQAVVDRLFATGDEPASGAEEGATLTEVAARLKSRSKLGEEGDHSVHTHLPHRAKIDPPLDAEEQQLLAQVRALPFGTWFELKSPGGDRVRRKLSWFSPLTGRCLFVNQRGAKVDETDIERLVREISRGRISVVEDKPDSLLDRAFGAIVKTLKQFAGQGGTA
ncbi:DUF1631 family protein [Ahniella affigens]|nr:DUF1631 family protein [Ahniella affigens]